MNRRTFITASASVAALATSTNGQSQTKTRLKVIIPAMNPEQLSEVQAAAPSVELVQCRNEDEAVERVMSADASYGFITPRVIRAGKSLRWVQLPRHRLVCGLRKVHLSGRHAHYCPPPPSVVFHL